MKINELEELAKEWNRFDADNEYSQSFLELIAAYREAVAALSAIESYDAEKEGDVSLFDCSRVWNMANAALATAKRLGVE